MKILYNRYTEFGCFSIRGRIGLNEWKMLRLGFDMLFKEMEEMLIINCVNAEIPADVLLTMIEYKKEFPKLTKQRVIVISKEKAWGDFPKFEIFLSRFQGSKMRQIGDKIILEDMVANIEKEIVTIEDQIKQLGFDENSSKKEIQKNNMVKTQKASLEGCIKWQRARKTSLQKVPSDVEDLDVKIQSTLDEVMKFLGKQVDL